MLTPEWHDYHLDALKAHKELQESIIRDIARRIAKANILTETADWQLSIAEEAGLCREEITRLVADRSGKSKKEIEALFEEAEKENFNFPENGFKVYGSELGRISPMIQRIWTAAASKTCTDAVNLTKTIALTSQTAYISACDLAHLQVESGAFDYNTAIANAVRNASGQGAVVLYPSGHSDSLDVAIRRAVLTSVNQTAGQCMLLKAEELDHDLMEITAHAGARPSHAVWQGQIVSRKGTAGYLSLTDIGYGEAGGFMGVNCRHNWSMYFEGSVRAYTPETLKEYNNATVSYNGADMPLYEATQRQRAFERKVRKTRNELVGLDEAVKENPQLKSEFAATSMKLKRQEAALKDFCNQTGIKYDSPRVQVQGFGRSVSQKAVWANKKGLTGGGKSGIIKSGTISGALNPDSEEANEHAKQYYQAVRKMKTDVNKISENTGYDKKTIQEIKDFVFMNKHDLGDGKYDYFYPSFEMAQSWQRLIDGKNIQPHDITLIKHEAMERDLMRAGLSQDEAHRLTSKTYNYKKESDEYYAKIEKNKKR